MQDSQLGSNGVLYREVPLYVYVGARAHVVYASMYM